MEVGGQLHATDAEESALILIEQETGWAPEPLQTL